MPQNKLHKIGPFPRGMDNRAPDHDLTARIDGGRVDLLREAVNVDLSSSGKLRRRGGFKEVFPGAAHSAWGEGHEGFYMAAGTLYQLTRAAHGGVQRTPIRSDLHPTRSVAFCEAGGTIYYTNGEVLGAVRHGVRLDFTPPPLTNPSVISSGGSGVPGYCSVCITHNGPAGESAATHPTTLQILPGGSVTVSGIRPPPPKCTVMVYATALNGEVFMRVADGVDGGISFAPPHTGADLRTLLLRAMPPGTAIQFSNARLVTANGSTLFFSEPFMPGLHDPGKNFIQFAEPITLLAACGLGLYVSAGKTYWLDGEITQAVLREVLPYAALPGSLGRAPDRPGECFWASERGLVVGSFDGTVRNVQEDRLALAGGTSAATVMHERHGQQHILSTTHNPGKTRAAFGGSFGAEIIRAGATP